VRVVEAKRPGVLAAATKAAGVMAGVPMSVPAAVMAGVPMSVPAAAVMSEVPMSAMAALTTTAAALLDHRRREPCRPACLAKRPPRHS